MVNIPFIWKPFRETSNIDLGPHLSEIEASTCFESQERRNSTDFSAFLLAS